MFLKTLGGSADLQMWMAISRNQVIVTVLTKHSALLYCKLPMNMIYECKQSSFWFHSDPLLCVHSCMRNNSKRIQRSWDSLGWKSGGLQWFLTKCSFISIWQGIDNKNDRKTSIALLTLKNVHRQRGACQIPCKQNRRMLKSLKNRHQAEVVLGLTLLPTVTNSLFWKMYL